MCRWLAYSGPPIRLEGLLFDGDNSLIQQSLPSRMGRAVANGDAVLVLSEPLDEDTDDWTEVPDGHMLIAQDGDITLTPLAL